MPYSPLWGNVAEQVQTAQSTNQNTGISGAGGGAWDWLSGQNVGGYADAFSTIFDSIKGNSGPDTVVYQTAPPAATPPASGSKWLIIGGIAFVGLIVFLVLRKRK